MEREDNGENNLSNYNESQELRKRFRLRTAGYKDARKKTETKKKEKKKIQNTPRRWLVRLRKRSRQKRDERSSLKGAKSDRLKNP